MDFRRVEQIFFIAFLCLNIFLFSIYQNGRMLSTQSQGTKTDSIEVRLDKDKITYPKFSTKEETGFYLAAEETNFISVINQIKKEGTNSDFLNNTITPYQRTLVVEPKKNLTLNPLEYEKDVRSILENTSVAIYGKEYVYAKEFSNLTGEYPLLKCYQTYKGVPIVDDSASIILSLRKNKTLFNLQDYEQRHLKKIEALRDKQVICTQKEAVALLYNNSKIPEKSSIQFIRLAYAKILTVKSKNIYIPVWFVGIKVNTTTTTIEAVNAMNSTLFNLGVNKTAD